MRFLLATALAFAIATPPPSAKAQVKPKTGPQKCVWFKDMHPQTPYHAKCGKFYFHFTTPPVGAVAYNVQYTCNVKAAGGSRYLVQNCR